MPLSIISIGALPKEQGRFREVDKEFRLIMADIASNPRLVVLSQRKDLSNLLKSMLDQLGRCQKALNELLEVGCSLSISRLLIFTRLPSGKTFDLSTFLLHW
jgi:dynein heavy chain 2